MSFTNEKLLSIGTDRSLFEDGSAVRLRQAEYAKERAEVHIIVFELHGARNREGRVRPLETVIAPNCWAYSTRSRSKFLYPFDAIRLGRFIAEKRGINRITCQDSSLTAMAGVSLKKRFGVPLEIQIHEDIGSPHYGYSLTNRIRKALALSYLPQADAIRVVSERIKKYLVELAIDASKITVRPIAVDTQKIQSALVIEGADLHKKYPQFDKIILMASRLEKEKNIPLALRAWHEVAKRFPRAGLIIVGRGSMRAALARQVSVLGLEGKVVFEDWADHERLISYFKTTDLFLNVSLFEGYGMTLVEARAAGCVVVSTDVGVAREMGASIIAWDSADIAEKISVALGAPAGL